MDLEIVGRHALFFDDDSMATFVNSATALVDWNGLFIDRYNVRHLLSFPPPRLKRRRPNSDDPDLELELDHERYLDLPVDLPAESTSPYPDENGNDEKIRRNLRLSIVYLVGEEIRSSNIRDLQFSRR
ncbi:hypothetical protein V5N11_011082 [Cardamine amara subsp. amara]|uniref:Suppressor of white apricot N-terminal domain-containing protein n=1 Tax=Cardamine amara subsp. amara TaxID=228776 RepID=A0ABD1BET9_CARAN